MRFFIFFLLILLLFLAACADDNSDYDYSDVVVENGSLVTFDYTGYIDDGTVFDTTVEDVAKSVGIDKFGPITITVGQSVVVSGLENALLGMKVDEKKTITLEPKDAYGEHIDGLYFKIDKRSFTDSGVEPKIGSLIGFRGENGADVKGTIVSIDDNVVIIDTNNPLAGKNVTYDIHVTDIY